MLNKTNSIFLVAVSTIILLSVGCKKGTFDINSPNPNVPSTVEPKFVLPAAMTSTAVLVAGNPGGGSQTGNDLFNIYMSFFISRRPMVKFLRPAYLSLRAVFKNVTAFASSWCLEAKSIASRLSR